MVRTYLTIELENTKTGIAEAFVFGCFEQKLGFLLCDLR